MQDNNQQNRRTSSIKDLISQFNGKNQEKISESEQIQRIQDPNQQMLKQQNKQKAWNDNQKMTNEQKQQEYLEQTNKEQYQTKQRAAEQQKLLEKNLTKQENQQDEKQLKEKQLKEQQEREEQEKQRRLEEERKKKMEAEQQRLLELQLKEKQLKEQQEREEQEKQRRLEEEKKKKMEAEQQRLLELQLKEKQLKEQQEKEQKQQELEYIQWQNNKLKLQQTKTQEMEVDESEIFYLLPQEQNSQPQQQYYRKYNIQQYQQQQKQQQQQQQKQKQQQYAQQQQQQQDKYFRALKKKQVTKKVINNNQPKQSLEFFKNPGTVDKKDKPILKYQFETQLNDLFLNLDKSKQIINPLSLVINQNINADNPEVLFHVLNDQLRQQNKVLFKSLKSDETLIYSFQGLFTAYSQDSKCFSLQLQETKNLNYNTIATDQQKREEFLKIFRQSLSIDLKVPESQIQIVGLERGSIKVIYEIINSAGAPAVNLAGAPIIKEFKAPISTSTLDELKRQFPGCEPKQQIHEYFQKAALSADDFDPRYNMDWDNYKFGNYDKNGRGPKGNTQPYFFPVGWKGYALKVAGKYDNGNDNWLMMNNNPEEWYVMFHGTKFEYCSKIVGQGLKEGNTNAYANYKCLINNVIIGVGVYFSNHIEVCEGYMRETNIGNKKFKIAFQTRVRPSALRQCPKDSNLSSKISDYKRENPSHDQSLNDMTLWDNDFFVVNKTEDIRPYRILLKVVE